MKFLKHCAGAMIAAALIASAAGAQDFPSRPIKLVIAFPAGGPTDFVGRLLADKLKDDLGQSVIIENKAGASGTLGADYVAKSDPDGHTLFLTTVGAVAITPNMRTDMPYNPVTDFAPITQIVRNTTVLVVRSDNPIAIGQGACRARQGEARHDPVRVDRHRNHDAPCARAVPVGGRREIPARALSRRRSCLTDLLGGQVQALFADVPVLLSQIEAGKLKPLAAASDQRNPMLPQIATLAELGYPDTQSDNWYGLLAPARTPRPIIMKLNAAVTRALADPEVSRKLLASGAIPAPTSPEQFGALLADELARWGRIVREKGIKDS